MRKNLFDFLNEYFNELENSFFQPVYFFTNTTYKQLSSKDLDKYEDEKSKAKDYKKQEFEKVKGDVKEITTEETWTNAEGYQCKLVTTRVEPNISKEELELTQKIDGLKKEIAEAVEVEDYEKAAKLKKELVKAQEQLDKSKK